MLNDRDGRPPPEGALRKCLGGCRQVFLRLRKCPGGVSANFLKVKKMSRGVSARFLKVKKTSRGVSANFLKRQDNRCVTQKIENDYGQQISET